MAGKNDDDPACEVEVTIEGYDDEPTDDEITETGAALPLELNPLEQLQFELEAIVEEEIDAQLQEMNAQGKTRLTPIHVLERMISMLDPATLKRRYQQELDSRQIYGEERRICQLAYSERVQEYANGVIVGEVPNQINLQRREAQQYVTIPRNVLRKLQTEVLEAEETSRYAALKSEFDTHARRERVDLSENMRQAVRVFAKTNLSEDKNAFVRIHETNGYELLRTIAFLLRKYDSVMTV